jgi:hypothetical protein
MLKCSLTSEINNIRLDKYKNNNSKNLKVGDYVFVSVESADLFEERLLPIYI